MEEIELKELLWYYLKKIPIIILTIILAILLGYLYMEYYQVPMYQGKTTIILIQKNDNISNDMGDTENQLNVNEKLVATYSEIIKSRRVLEQVIDELDLDLTYEELHGKISVSAVNNTEIIKITVNDADGIKAKNIANITANYFAKEIVDLYNMNNVDILDEAIEANKPYNINIIKQVIIYFMLGFVLAAGVLFIIYYFDRTVKSIEQVEQKIKLPILGGVQEYQRGAKK